MWTVVANDKVVYVNYEEKFISDILETRKPKVLALGFDKYGSKYIAVDNTTGDAWTEEFLGFDQAIEWLTGGKQYDYRRAN